MTLSQLFLFVALVIFAIFNAMLNEKVQSDSIVVKMLFRLWFFIMMMASSIAAGYLLARIFFAEMGY